MKTFFTLIFSLLFLNAFSQCLIDSSNSTFQAHHTGGVALGIGEYFEGNFTIYIPYGQVNDPALFPAPDGFIYEASIWAIQGLPTGIQFEAYLDNGTLIDTSGMADTNAIRFPVPIDPGYLRFCIRLFGIPTETTASDNFVEILFSLGANGYPFPLLPYQIDFVVFEDIYTPEICIVNTDMSSGFNQIIWNKLQSNVTDSFRIYSSLPSSPQQIDLIGQVAYVELSVFVDTVNTSQDTEINYFLSMVNNSGLESSLSQRHTNIHLNIDTVGGEIALSWNEYYPYLTPTDDYVVYSGTSPDNLSIQQNVPNWLTGWTLPLTWNLTYYAIGTTFGATCAPSRSNDEQVFSNVVSNELLLSVDNLNLQILQIYPNPATTQLTIESQSAVGNKQLAEIYDLTGKLLLQFTVSSQKTTLDISALSSGIYFLTLSDGEQQVNRKVIKQ